MEPQIIDYYNEMPSGVHIINKLNDEFAELQKNYDELKKELEKYKKPTKIFKSNEDWNNTKNKVYEMIREIINKCIVENEIEYRSMRHFGICPIQIMDIGYTLQDGLELLTDNKEWSVNESYYITCGIKSFIQGFIESGKWHDLYDSVDAQKLADIIYNNIKYQLDDESHWPCILEDIALFKCVKCNKIDNYVNDDNLCEVCEKI